MCSTCCDDILETQYLRARRNVPNISSATDVLNSINKTSIDVKFIRIDDPVHRPLMKGS